MKLLAVGTVAFDCVETPFGKRDDILGGSVSYLGTSASYFTDVQMVSVIGEDFPEEILKTFQGRGIDIEGVKRLPGKTFRWRGHYMDDINEAKTLETQLNVLEAFDTALPAHFRESKNIVLGNIAPHLQTEVLDQVIDPQLVAADTMNFWIDGARDDLEKVIKRVDILSINDGEAKLLSGKNNLVDAAAEIRAMGPDMLVIKRGEHGALAFFNDEMFSVPAYPLKEVVDPTGAGDSFAGGLMGYLTRHGKLDAQSFRQAILMGSVMASYNVQDFSLGRLAELSPSLIRERIRDFNRLIHVNIDGIDVDF